MWPKVGPGTQRAKLSAPAAEARSCGEVCKCLPHAASVGSSGLVQFITRGPERTSRWGQLGTEMTTSMWLGPRGVLGILESSQGKGRKACDKCHLFPVTVP